MEKKVRAQNPDSFHWNFFLSLRESEEKERRKEKRGERGKVKREGERGESERI